MAKCMHCEKAFVAGSTKGTSYLRNHLLRCGAKNDNVGQSSGTDLMNPSDGSSKSQPFKFDQQKSREDLAKMIIMHKYPFNMAEHEFFEAFCHGLNPNFKLVSRNTLRSDVIAIHHDYKQKLYNFIDGLTSKITLTTDIWTAENQNFAYTCLTAHYIDDDWNLIKKFLSYRRIEYPHDGQSLFEFISELILEWNIDRKIFAMVVDNASANDCMVRSLKYWLCEKSLLPSGGEFFHVRCSAHILNFIVQDGLEQINGLLEKIRETVRYLHKSPSGKQKFDNALSQAKLRGRKKIPMNVPHRWNSTFDMLDCALPLRQAFDRLELLDKSYKFNPSEEEWQIASIVRNCLKIFYDATRYFSGTNFPIANVFFVDICEIEIKLAEWAKSEHEFLHRMASPMKVKFVKYWEKCSLVLGIAVVFDPRCKMAIVEYYYDKIYESDSYEHVKRVRDALFALFDDYGGNCNDSNSFTCDEDGGSVLLGSSQDDKLSGFHKWYMQASYNDLRVTQKSELDMYLDEPLIMRKGKESFNILDWWKCNSVQMPILARIARDVLAVPATTVASKRGFSIGGRVIDDTRASLLPDVVEALVTTSDWIPSKRLQS